MIHREIALGETSSYRYFGVTPPVSDEKAMIMADILFFYLPRWAIYTEDTTLYLNQLTSDTGTAFTEFGVEAGDAIDVLGEERVDADCVLIAHALAKILREGGDSVSVNENIAPIDYQSPLFGIRYTEFITEVERIQEIRAKQACNEAIDQESDGTATDLA